MTYSDTRRARRLEIRPVIRAARGGVGARRCPGCYSLFLAGWSL